MPGIAELQRVSRQAVPTGSGASISFPIQTMQVLCTFCAYTDRSQCTCAPCLPLNSRIPSTTSLACPAYSMQAYPCPCALQCHPIMYLSGFDGIWQRKLNHANFGGAPSSCLTTSAPGNMCGAVEASLFWIWDTCSTCCETASRRVSLLVLGPKPTNYARVTGFTACALLCLPQLSQSRPFACNVHLVSVVLRSQLVHINA